MRLATFNVLHGRSLADGLVDLDRLGDACASLDADVLGLQEVDRDQPRSGGADLTEVAAKATGAVAWRFEPALVGTPGGAWRPASDDDEEPGPAYGVGLVSRHPVSAWDVIRLSPARVRAPILVPGSRRAMWLDDEPRVALCARVEAPGLPLTVATTHLSFVPGWNVVQLRRLVNRLARDLPPPYVVLGDLNAFGALPRLVTRWRPLATAKTFPAPAPRVQLDHVLASGVLPRVSAARAVELPLSDHRALVVDLAGG